MSFLKGIFGTLALLLVLLLAWGTLIEPRFLLDEQRHEAEVPHLPADWDGRTVALLADLQVGMWFDNTGMVERAVEAALEADPALVLVAGDFVYTPDSAIVREAVGLLAPLREADVPVAVVLGNHDYSMMKEDSQISQEMAQYLSDQLRQAGVEVLENESLALTPAGGGEALHVVGVGSEWAGRSRPAEALAGVPEDMARIVLMHNPVAYRDLPAHTAPLTLAAHTHGGQVRLPLLPSESWLDIARPREVVADGWAEDGIGKAGNRLYVNRGIGFSNVPIRLFCRPELTLLTLRAAAGDLPDRGPTS